MRKISGFLAVLCCAVLAMAQMCAAAEVVAEGTCGGEGDGSNLSWQLTEDNVLTISGTGAMADYAFDVKMDTGVTSYGPITPPPWYEYDLNDVRLFVEEGVTSIGDYAFTGCDVLDAFLPDSVTRIGDYAFFSAWTRNLRLGAGVREIGSCAFYNCLSSLAVFYPGSREDWAAVTLGANNDALTGAMAGTSTSGTHMVYGADHMVIFLHDNGSSPSYSSGSSRAGFADGAGLEFPKNPTRDGYEFEGWQDENGQKITEGTPVIRNMTLRAVWGGNVSSGTCGEGLTWSLDPEGTLTIRGTGAMEDYNSYLGAPWKGYEVKQAVVEEGVTAIGAYAFAECRMLERIKLPDSLTEIREGAFYVCGLSGIVIPANVTTIGDEAFIYSSLTTFTLPKSLKRVGEDAFHNATEYFNAVIYYEGGEEDFAAIDVGGGNDALENGNIRWLFDYRFRDSACRVRFMPNGGVLEGGSVIGVDGTLEEFPAEPEREGYTFAGWYTDQVWGEKVSLGDAFTQDATLYAHWAGEHEEVTSYTEDQLETVILSERESLRGALLTYGLDKDESMLYYARWSSPVYSCLLEQEGGYLAVDGDETADLVYLTYYDKQFNRLSQRTLPYELPLFGGFFAGETCNYIVFAQNNDEEDDGKEVFRLVKYDKDFNRLGSASLSGCDTAHPLDAGSLRMAENGNELTIHASREFYADADGVNHQGNLTTVINTDTMQVVEEPAWHVSHSFDQYVVYDGSDHILLDHGDAGTRGAVLKIPLTRYPDAFEYRSIMLLSVPGRDGLNWTGMSIGGFAMSDTAYIAAVNALHPEAAEYEVCYDASPYYAPTGEQRDVILLLSDRDNRHGAAVRREKLTDYYGNGMSGSAPRLVSLGDDRFAVLWEEYTYIEGDSSGSVKCGGVRYLLMDGEGDVLTDSVLLPGARLSKYCQPIADGDSIVWYVDREEDEWLGQTAHRTFHRIDLTAEETELTIRALAREEGMVTAEIACAAADAAVLCAAYDGAGRMLSCAVQSLELGRNACSFELDAPEEATVFIFIVDGNYAPLCQPVSVPN